MTPEQAAAAIVLYGTQLNAAKQLGLPRSTVRYAHKKAIELGLCGPAGQRGRNRLNGELYNRDKPKEPVVAGRVHKASRDTMPLPKKGKIARYIVTCAQNNTHLHEGLWANLQTLAQHYGARILISKFTYNTASFGREVKPGTEQPAEDLWYDPRIEPHVYDKSAELAPGLIWCGETNMLPTAVRPLSGYESYTGRASGIFPHPKYAMESIASGKHEPTKFNYTTGTLTQRNYIQKKAGQKAEFHHCYGALLVEVDHVGSWWVRQLNADSDGTIYNLDMRVESGMISTGHRVEAITWGDIHVGRTDPVVKEVQWGKGGVLDKLRPKYQFAHDILDFHSRNHHDAKNPHVRFARYMAGEDNVAKEVEGVREFINWMERPWCETIIVDSNHDNALTRWLREADARHDPVNAIFYHEAQLAMYRSIAALDTSSKFHLLEWACRRAALDDDAVLRARFLREDESFIICRDAHGGIECGMHGHLGPNGSRPSEGGFSKMGRKKNRAHKHSPGIHDGDYVAGTSTLLDLGYNRGPGSWSHSFIVTYENGKRCICTIWRGKAWASA